MKKAKKVAVKKVSPVKVEFGFNEQGMLSVKVAAGKRADERLVTAAQTAAKMFFENAVENGGVPVNIGGQLIIASRVQY